jgi:hypothetical protein
MNFLTFFTTVLLLACTSILTNAQQTCEKELEFVNCTEAILFQAETVCLDNPTEPEKVSCACNVMTDIITECLPMCPVTALARVKELVAPYLDQCPAGTLDTPCAKEEEFLSCMAAITLEVNTVCVSKATQEEIESCACAAMTSTITECLPMCPVTALEATKDLVAPYKDKCPAGTLDIPSDGTNDGTNDGTSPTGEPSRSRTRVGGGSVFAAVVVSLIAMLLI